MSRTLKILGLGLASVVGALLIFLAVVAYLGPETSVYPGRQVPKRFLATVRALKLLKPDEQIRYFYSDGFLDIKDGLYFVTDKTLVLYSNAWEDPAVIIPLDQIETLDAEYDASFFVDSLVTVTTTAGLEVSFPVSSEKGLDKKFVAAIEEKRQTASGGGGRTAP